MLPKKNEPDLDDLPPAGREAMTFLPVETLDEVLAVALLPLLAEEPGRSVASHDLVPLANPAAPSRPEGHVPSAALTRRSS